MLFSAAESFSPLRFLFAQNEISTFINIFKQEVQNHYVYDIKTIADRKATENQCP
jgi:hypothetical protein